MNEVFTDVYGTIFTVNDEGITIKDVLRVVFFPYGSIESKLKVGIFGLIISGHGINHGFVPQKEDKARFKAAIDYASKANSQATPCTPTESDVKDKEYKIRCNVCGNIFCYTDKDIRDNERNALMASVNRQGAVLGALGGTTLQASADSAEADRYDSKIKDFTHCPKCNSTDLKELSDEEFNSLQNTSENEQQIVSSMDELKKLKELLDLGIVSQEEFDAKKKQLLGL